MRANYNRRSPLQRMPTISGGWSTSQDLSAGVVSIIEFLVIGRHKFFETQTKVGGFLLCGNATMEHSIIHAVVPAKVWT